MIQKFNSFIHWIVTVAQEQLLITAAAAAAANWCLVPAGSAVLGAASSYCSPPLAATYHTLHNCATVLYEPLATVICHSSPAPVRDSSPPPPPPLPFPFFKYTCSVPHSARSKSHTNTSFVSWASGAEAFRTRWGRAREPASERRHTPPRRTQELLWAKLGLAWLVQITTWLGRVQRTGCAPTSGTRKQKAA